jgi:uncharacterized membrane protein SirB2
MSLLKALHISCVAISYTLFFLRGIWMLNNACILQQRWIKIVPHLVDTLLILSAILLAYSIGQYPLHDDWLTEKFLALLLYIGLGSVALHYGRTKVQRLLAWLTAQAVFACIVVIAIRHAPLIQ